MVFGPHVGLVDGERVDDDVTHGTRVFLALVNWQRILVLAIIPVPEAHLCSLFKNEKFRKIYEPQQLTSEIINNNQQN